MGKFKPGPMGFFAGKVGSVVGATWKGQPYLRSLPRVRKTRRKLSDKEKKVLQRFSMLHYWLRPLLSFLQVGFKNYTPLVEGFNAAKSYALKNAFRMEGDDKIFDPSLVLVSYGDLGMPDITVRKVEDYLLEFNWDNTSDWEQSHKYDQVMLLAYDNEHMKLSMQVTGQFRHIGKDTLNLSPLQGCSYHVYAAFVAHDRSRQSNSVYLGVITT